MSAQPLSRSGIPRRDEIVPRIQPWYRGDVHFLLLNAMGGALMLWALSGVHWPTLPELALAPVAFLFINFAEWATHRGPMHHPGIPAILYQRHTLLHHASFTHESMAVRSHRELRIVLFPLWALLVPAGIVGIGALGIAALTTPNAARVFYATALGYYLLYEWCHLTYHLPDAWWITRTRMVSFMRRHHQRHHDPRVMTKKNFNVTFPIADVLLGTYDGGEG